MQAAKGAKAKEKESKMQYKEAGASGASEVPVKEEATVVEMGEGDAMQEELLKKKRTRGSASGAAKRGSSAGTGKNENDMSWGEAFGHVLTDTQMQLVLSGTVALASMAVVKSMAFA